MRDDEGLSRRWLACRRVVGVLRRSRESGLAGMLASSACSRSKSLRDRFLPEAESAEGLRVGVVSAVERVVGEELNAC